MTYKTGSARMPESYNCTCDLKWLGWRAAQIEQAQLLESSKQKFTKHDEKCVESLLDHSWIKAGTPESKKYVHEVQQMKKHAIKVELEAIALGFLETFLISEIAAKRWI
jgi:DNA topoisomerase VI subunit A